jgi:hypothetical protein
MGRSVVWSGSGCQRFLIGFSSGQVGTGDRTKLKRVQEGAVIAWHSHSLSSVEETA